MKACWCDDTLLPDSCVLDSGDEAEIYGCVHARDGEIVSREDCPHWNVELAIELCREILGESYTVIQEADHGV